ncbi:MAG: VapE domain-containing protein [Cyanobacteria bacterium P01_A01_bin.17]
MTSLTFNILDYLDQLKPDGGSETETDRSFHCPVCHSKNFKVSLNTGKYKTFGCSCMDTSAGKQAMIKAITTLGWHKPVRTRQKRIWEYRDEHGVPLITVHRQDDGDGKRRFWQKPLQQGKPAALKQRARPYRYQECLKAMLEGRDVSWVEGESCADALRSLGIPATTTIGGTNNYRSEQYRGLFPEPAPGVGNLVLCPDRDQVGLNYMEAIAADYPWAKWCYAFPESFLWQRLPKDGGADMADWIDDGATATTIRQVVGQQRTDVVPIKIVTVDVEQENTKASTDSKPNRFKQQFEAIDALWGERLRFNELTKDIEFDGDPIDVGEARVRLAIEENLDISLNNLELMLTYMAERQSYHPVREELERCHERYKNTAILDNLAERFFGVNNPLYDIYLRRTLIAAVKRIYEPGCKVDTVLVLQGPQGYFKSSFFQTLAGAAYFDDSFGSMSDKDERLKLHLVWFCEWAELESVYRRRDSEAIKAFLSSGTDLVRAPYARKAERLRRQSFIVASTNQDQFLNDPCPRYV